MTLEETLVSERFEFVSSLPVFYSTPFSCLSALKLRSINQYLHIFLFLFPSLI